MIEFFTSKNGYIWLIGLLMVASCANYKTLDFDGPEHSSIWSLNSEQCNNDTEVLVDVAGRSWNACSRDGALSTFEYAQIASNVYHEDNQFRLGPHIKPLNDGKTLPSGLTYDVYARLDGNEYVEIIVAFRGTNFKSPLDWIYGNFGTRQRREGLDIYDHIYEKYGVVPSVTGHSLGGAIATQVSLCRDVDVAMFFHTSPRFSRRLCKQTSRTNIIHHNHNISVVEHGEVNKILRAPSREPNQRYVQVSCFDKGGPIAQHNMGKFAACLTQGAGLERDPVALASIARNKIENPIDWGSKE